MTLPDQPDLRHSPLFVQVPPLFEGNSFPSRGRPRQGTTQYITQFRHVNRSTLARWGVKRQQTLRRSGTVISTPDMANPRPFLPSLSLLHASLLSCNHSFQNILSYFPYEFPFFYGSECRTIP